MKIILFLSRFKAKIDERLLAGESFLTILTYYLPHQSGYSDAIILAYVIGSFVASKEWVE